jgi:hypothetical protein
MYLSRSIRIAAGIVGVALLVGCGDTPTGMKNLKINEDVRENADIKDKKGNVRKPIPSIPETEAPRRPGAR